MEDHSKICLTAMEVLAAQLGIAPEALAQTILKGIARPWTRIMIMSNLIAIEHPTKEEPDGRKTS